MRTGNLSAPGSFPWLGKLPGSPPPGHVRGAEHSRAANAIITQINNYSPSVTVAPREMRCGRNTELRNEP